MAILDQPGGNANAQIQAGPLDRPIKAYQWTCSNPGCPNPNQIGRVEDGCIACGSGADAVAGQPLAPPDFNCQACKGTGTVERRCGTCEGTGMLDAPSLGEPPPTCDKCGGAGTIALGCGRCEGSGIDPKPEVKAIPAAVLIESGRGEMEREQPPIQLTPPLAPPQAGIFKGGLAASLPSIDEDAPAVTSPDTVVRYRLIRYEGPKGVIARTFDMSLNGTLREQETAVTAIEIAEPKSPGLQQAINAARGQDPVWRARHIFPKD